jgi:serine/threonine protein kinase/tetratricopeptide (TPR) repeat protein
MANSTGETSMASDSPDDDNTRTYVVLTKGTMVSHYRIIEKIGAGGMGEVYLAEDTELARKVALKFLPPHLCQDEDCRKRFKREAQAVAKLNHPNIITIHEVSEYHGRLFFAMELVEGQSLREMAKGKELGIDRIIELAIQVCDGLGAAHDKRVIHRDIKPSNIVIDAYGRPKILDFGLAAIQGGEHLTQTGSTLGTVGYMSPEQVLGDEIDHRSDLFSLGVVLYEMIAGRTPFERDNEAATLKAIGQDSPEPLARYKSDISDELQRTVSKLLEKDPSMRYQSAAGLISDFKTLGRDQLSDSKEEVSRPSIAVLPFTNLSADPEQEYFCDGMAEEIINALTHVEGLRVVARTSCFAFKGKHIDIREIGRKLNVDNVLEGSVRKAGGRVRITGQLIKISDGYHLWSDKFDRDLEDVFEVQDEISLAIVQKLKTKLLGGEHEQIVKRPTDNLDAYNLYLRGRYHWNKRSPKEVQRAIECLKGAVELDPEFTLGYAGLADAYVIQADNIHVHERRPTLLALAEKSVFKALELDSSLAEAHAALAQIRFSQWEWHEAEKEHLLAIKLNPRYATAHHWYSIFLAAKGRFAQSWEHIKLARMLDPLSPAMITAQAFICYLLRQYDKAIELCREGSELYADSPLHSLITGWSLLEKGNHSEAIKQFYRSIEFIEKELPGEDDPFCWKPYIGTAYAMMDEYGKAKEILEDTIERTKDQNVQLSPIAILCFEVGEMDRGFEWLERSVEEREFWLPVFRSAPSFDSFRNDPRFLSLMHRIGLDQDVQEIQDD